MSTFVPEISASLLSVQKLYHAIPRSPEGDYIKTSDNYGTNILPAERIKLGMTPNEHTPLVFAATTFYKALAFTITKGEALFNASIDAANTEIAVVCDRDNFMKRVRDATIYSFPDTGFVRLTNAENQSVSTQPVPFTATDKNPIKIKSADDMMREGLQIFAFKEDFRTVYQSDAKKELLDSKKSLTEALGDLVKSGKIVWENQARGINPNTALAKQMGIELPPTQSASQAKPSVNRKPALLTPNLM